MFIIPQSLKILTLMMMSTYLYMMHRSALRWKICEFFVATFSAFFMCGLWIFYSSDSHAWKNKRSYLNSVHNIIYTRVYIPKNSNVVRGKSLWCLSPCEFMVSSVFQKKVKCTDPVWKKFSMVFYCILFSIKFLYIK